MWKRGAMKGGHQLGVGDADFDQAGFDQVCFD
jgi:hypothetical protein